MAEDRRKRRAHLDRGEAGSEALVRTSSPWREDVGSPVLIARQPYIASMQASKADRKSSALAWEKTSGGRIFSTFSNLPE